MSTQVVAAHADSLTGQAWEAIHGAYDLQVHVAPDVIERRIDDIGLAQEFLEKGLKGFVLKSHYIPTATGFSPPILWLSVSAPKAWIPGTARDTTLARSAVGM